MKYDPNNRCLAGREPGSILQAGYDPNYTGTFVEMGVGEPPVFIQLPAVTLGEGAEYLQIERPGNGRLQNDAISRLCENEP